MADQCDTTCCSENSIQKTNLLGLNRSQMQAFFESIGEKKFRAQQVMKWIHSFGVTNFHEMTDISKPLREKLSFIAEVRAPDIINEYHAGDGVKKWTIRSRSGSLVETVYIPERGRGTLCVSSQVGCVLDCSFCSTGKQGFNSDLTSAEIIGQAWQAVHSFPHSNDKKKRNVTNVVMMGMGEPLMNFDPVMTAMDLMMDDWAYGLSKRRVTLSTSGVVPTMHKMIGRTDVSLAVSLHAPTDELRNKLVPINRKYPLKQLLAAIDCYMASLPDKSRVVTIEYTLLKSVNDQQQHAMQLAELLKNTPCKINLIPFNPFPHSGYETPSNNAIRKFQTMLQQAGFNVTVRKTRGDDIDAACGQLVGQVTDKTKRNARYRQSYASNVQALSIVDPT